MSDYQKIGKLGKTHGYKGAIKVTIIPEAISYFTKQKAFFINIKGEQIPFFYNITSAFLNDTCILELDDLTTKEQAQKLTGMEVYLQTNKVFTPVSKDPGIVGYTVNDKTEGDIGIVEELIELPHQSLAQISHNGKPVLIPLHPDFILEVNKSKKILFLDLPGGLLDL